MIRSDFEISYFFGGKIQTHLEKYINQYLFDKLISLTTFAIIEVLKCLKVLLKSCIIHV